MSISSLFYPNNYDLYCKSLTYEQLIPNPSGGGATGPTGPQGNPGVPGTPGVTGPTGPAGTSSGGISGIVDVWNLLSVPQQNDVVNGTASIDLTATLNSIIALNAQRYLYFRNGTWRIDGTLVIITSGTSLIGEGVGLTKFYFNNGALNCIDMIGGISAHITYNQIKGIQFTFPTPAGKTSGICINMEYCDFTDIDNINISNGPSGIRVYGCYGTIINDVVGDTMKGNTINEYGIKIHANDDGTNVTKNIKVNNCYFDYAYLTPVGINIENNVQNCELLNCVLLRCKYAIHVYSPTTNAYYPKDLTFTNLYCKGAIDYSVLLTSGENLKISQSYLSNDTGAIGQGSNDSDVMSIFPAGISQCNNFKILNNTLEAPKQNGIFFDGRDVLISGNSIKPTIVTPNTSAISLGSNSQNTLIISNIIEPFPSVGAFDYGVTTALGSQRFLNIGNDWSKAQIKSIRCLSVDTTSFIGYDLFKTPRNSNCQLTIPFTFPVTNPANNNLSAQSVLQGVLLLPSALVGVTSCTFPTAQDIITTMEPMFQGMTIQLMINNISSSCGYSFANNTGLVFNNNTVPTFLLGVSTSRIVYIYIDNVTPGSESVIVYV